MQPCVKTLRTAEMPRPRYSLVTPPADNRLKMSSGRSYIVSASAFRCTLAFTKSIG